jgi:hypothetical protein
MRMKMRMNKEMDEEMYGLMERSYDLFTRLPFVILIGVFFGLSVWIYNLASEDQMGSWGKKSAEGYIDSSRQEVTMTKVEAITGKGLVEIPLDSIRQNKLVSFEYAKKETHVPLLAIATPSGKILTVLGISDPCGSTSFHLEGNEIVCDLCFTRWKIETLKGVNGECHAVPPEMIAHFVHKGRLFIREVDILNSVRGKSVPMGKLGTTKT